MYPTSEKAVYEELTLPQKILVIIFLIMAIWYLSWRVTTFNPQAMTFSIVLYCAEVYGIITTVLHLFMNWRLRVRHAPPPVAGLSVDVFIPTYNEDSELIRKTLIAATNMDYPHETWLLDDGNREEMRILANELGVRYVSRQNNVGAKAGNLNNALRLSKASFVAIFDADHAPSQKFLTHTLGFFRDSKVAFVQTPQDFYNLDSYQHRWSKNLRSIWTEQSLFFRVIQRGKDYWNAAFFCGSCAIIRREAIDSINGFAEETITEDLHTSIRLHKKGWKSVYHSESLAFGVAPSGVGPFLKQRIRWGQGAMQVWKIESVLTSHKLSLAQRLNYFASMATYFDGWQRMIFYISPIIVLTTGVMPIDAIGAEFLWHFIPYYILTFWVFEEISRGYGRSLFIEQYNMGRFAGFCWSTLGLFRKSLKFQVTPKDLTEKSVAILYLLPQLLILALSALAIVVGVILFTLYSHLPLGGTIANILWACANGSLAYAIIQFSMLHNRNKRTSYRFQIPLPAEIYTPDLGSRVVTVDDISLSGCRLYGPLPKMISIGTIITGRLYLPSGVLPFNSQVTSLIPGTSSSGTYLKGIGCKFKHSRQQDDALSLFLYGSDLQWQIMRLSERVNTPLQKLSNIFSGNKKDVLKFSNHHWSAMQYTLNNGSNIPYLGLASVEHVDRATPQHALLFQSVKNGSVISGLIVTRTIQTKFEAIIDGCVSINNPLGPLYQYDITSFRVTSIWHNSLVANGQNEALCQNEVAR